MDEEGRGVLCLVCLSRLWIFSIYLLEIFTDDLHKRPPPLIINTMPTLSQVEIDASPNELGGRGDLASTTKVSNTLRGYRIGLLKDYSLSGLYSDRRKWLQVKSQAGPLSTLPIFQYAPSSEYNQFKIWWDAQMRQAREEKLTLIVVDVNDSNNSWRQLLKRIEEEEWDGGVEDGLKFTKLDNLLEAISTGALPLDMWGDGIERGENVHTIDKNVIINVEKFYERLNKIHAHFVKHR